jgi:hypothetical protein
MVNNIDHLLKQIEKSEMDSKEWRSALFELVDCHHSEVIVPFLFTDMKRRDIQFLSGTYVWAAGEISIEQCVTEYNYLMELLILSNYEVAWSVDSIFNKLQNYFKLIPDEWFREQIIYLNENWDNEHPNSEFIGDVLFYFEKYIKEITNNSREV